MGLFLRQINRFLPLPGFPPAAVAAGAAKESGAILSRRATLYMAPFR